MPLVDRHIGFVEALRAAGVPVSLAEDLDAVHAVTALGLGDRETVRAALAATLVKRETHRASFDALFDLHFPALLGDRTTLSDPAAGEGTGADPDTGEDDGGSPLPDQLRAELLDALLANDEHRLRELAVRSVTQLGAIPGRGGTSGSGAAGSGASRWSSYNTMRALNPDVLTLRLARALMAGDTGRVPRSEALALQTATHRMQSWQRRVESDVRRRLAADKGPEQVARTTLRPSLDQLSFTSARREEIDEMRRAIYPLARRLATRLAKEQHARRRGPLDFRRTVRASMSTGGVPLTTHHRPRRPHRSELVVLCDVSGSVANFASFTLLLVFALREHFGKVRAFTFVDDVHEVTDDLVRGGDPEETLTRLVASSRHASLWGRTNYGRALGEFHARYADALTPKSTLLVLGDGRSNYTDPGLDRLRELAGRARHAWWLNPEHARQWGTGDSAAPAYAEVVPMVECRNLTQLTEFVHDIV